MDESLEKQAVDSESGGVERENSRVELEVFKLTFNLILLSHTFELSHTVCVCFNPCGHRWSIELLMLSYNIIYHKSGARIM